MPPRLEAVARRLGRFEKLLLLLLPAYAAAILLAPGSAFAVLISLAFYALALVVAVRLLRSTIRQLIWRLRNRLIVAYLFIAVVPVILIMVLVGIATYMVTGQIAVYLVSSELDRRTAALRAPAEALARTPAARRPDVVARLVPLVRERFPDLQILVRGTEEYRYPETAHLQPPPPGWKDATGIVVKGGHLYGWAHVIRPEAEVTLFAPLTHELLADLVPGLGDVFFLKFSEAPVQRRSGIQLKYNRKTGQLDELTGARKERIPPKYNSADLQITGVYLMPISFWESPEKAGRGLLVAQTRLSAVLGIVFGQKMNWGELALALFLGVAILFLVVEIISLVIGISITRTITRAVHDIYEGTRKVQEGDFSHRIAIRGRDQLAELGASFNTMMENLERLIVVAKEKERLQSELEIAREVQAQLFPKNIPHLKTLELTGQCTPARMVSGDYYDFLALPDGSLAFAIGDVAGKGISAALLMAAIQSTMRTQLATTAPALVATVGGHNGRHFSAAELVSLLNKQLYENTSPEKYATFCFALYDEHTRILTYTNAGHLPPILLHDGQAAQLEVTGTVVGAFPFARYDEKQIELAKGDLLVAYTDGIVEPENEYGEMFGEARFQELLVKYAQHDSSEIISRTMEAVQRWTGSSEPQDDMTMLVARRI